ncbi:MAG: ComEC/Rec2 family competence protein [Verrucomicrobiota bacterium]
MVAIIGIITADNFSVSWWWPALIAFATLLLTLRIHARSLTILFAFVFSTFAALHALQLQSVDLFPLTAKLNHQQALRITAKGTLLSLNPGSTQTDPATGIFKLNQVTLDNQQYPASHRVRLSLPPLPPLPPESTSTPIATGRRFKISGSLRALSPARNPAQFSLAESSRRRGIVANLVVFSPYDIQPLPSHADPLTRLRSAANTSRNWIADTITAGLQNSPNVSAVLRAMALGSREETPRAIEDTFRESGSMHIFAVSGLHVGILAFIIWQLLKILGLRRSIAALIVIPCLFYYALITGWRPSAVRAAIMTSIFLAGFGFQRQPRILNSLGAAALVILLYDTQQLFMPGFQLSFLVLTSIALFTPLFQRPLKKLVAPDPFLPPTLIGRTRRTTAAIGEKAADLFAVSAAAWIGSVPLILWHFQMLTPVAVIANCFLVPLAFAVLAVASLSLLASATGLGTLSLIFNNTNWLLAKILLAASAAFANLPGGHFYFDHSPFPKTPPHCRITVFDTTGGGAAQLIEPSHPNQPTAWLIDAGNKDAFFDVVRPLLRQRSLDQHITALVLSHGDSRHLGGAPYLIRDLAPAAVYESPLPNSSPFYRDTLLAAESLNIPLTQVTAGDSIPASPLTRVGSSSAPTLRVLFPPPEYQPSAHADDHSLVLQLESDGWRILFMNDAGFATEKWLLDNASNHLPSHILVKGRHASDFSGLTEFLNAVQPLAVISTNARFPPEEQIPAAWKAILIQKNITLFDQANTGAVEIQCHPDRLEIEGFLNNQTFTQHAP